jgi:hypothetical protein
MKATFVTIYQSSLNKTAEYFRLEHFCDHLVAGTVINLHSARMVHILRL